MKNLITTIAQLSIAAIVAYFIVRVWEDWSNDLADERDRKRRAIQEHPSSSGPRHE
jgi:hypothetical protein